MIVTWLNSYCRSCMLVYEVPYPHRSKPIKLPFFLGRMSFYMLLIKVKTLQPGLVCLRFAALFAPLLSLSPYVVSLAKGLARHETASLLCTYLPTDYRLSIMYKYIQ